MWLLGRATCLLITQGCGFPENALVLCKYYSLLQNLPGNPIVPPEVEYYRGKFKGVLLRCPP